MKAYKVLRRTKYGRLVSCKIEGYLQTEYKENEQVEPKVGRLLAFKTFDAAARFEQRHNLALVEIWECEVVKGRAHNLTFYDDACFYESGYLNDFLWWRKFNGTMNAPAGTIFCKKIKLVKKVTK